MILSVASQAKNQLRRRHNAGKSGGGKPGIWESRRKSVYIKICDDVATKKEEGAGEDV